VTGPGQCAGGETEKREAEDFLVREQGSLVGPSKAHVIRRELRFLEALLSQHKAICALKCRTVSALPPSLSLAGGVLVNGKVSTAVDFRVFSGPALGNGICS